MNEKTAWYLGFREKTAANRLAKWIADKRRMLSQIENLGLAEELAEELTLWGKRGKNLPEGITPSGSSKRLYVTNAINSGHAAKYPRSYGSTEAANRTTRRYFSPATPYDPDVVQSYFDVMPLTRPLGGRRLPSGEPVRRSARLPLSPLGQLSRAEKRIGKPVIPDVEPPPFVPLELPA
jgi:hypothetical protein